MAMAITETFTYGAAWCAVAISGGMVLRTLGRVRDVGSALAATSLAFEILFGAGALGVAAHFLRTGEPMPIAWFGGAAAAGSATGTGAGGSPAAADGAHPVGGAVAPAWPPATWPASTWPAATLPTATWPAGHDGPAPTGRPCGAAATDAGHGVSICLAP
ncbi:hypothetical protein [Prosthecomicrobium hirschii]|uniref:hypothetical protein n=1 Tax=Prosthecodimorpha hirschii TaxID=665126 RepID=UPI002220C172|nr:hypothetical protein [Prosthecomicrobium hirschii]MCW1840886.1 hypothetical protein [Prosthecomicrobium hirschii]